MPPSAQTGCKRRTYTTVAIYALAVLGTTAACSMSQIWPSNGEESGTEGQATYRQYDPNTPFAHFEDAASMWCSEAPLKGPFPPDSQSPHDIACSRVTPI